MSEALTVLNNNPAAMALSGVGLGSTLFKARPNTIQLVPKSTRQEDAIPGTFRVMATGQRLGVSDANGNIVKDEIRVVLLAVPQQQREWYLNDGKTYSKEMKQCFSTDNVRPHARAKNPPAMMCATCPKGDINWKKWREGGKTPDLLPPCQMYYHVFLAERNTQTPYYINIGGKSVMEFENAMKNQMANLLANLQANVVLLNKQRGYKYNKTSGAFDFIALPEGQTEQQLALPLPNIFDVSFTIYVNKKDGDVKMGFKDFAAMKPEDSAEFGALYSEFLQAKQAAKEAYEAKQAASEEQQGNEAVTEQTASTQGPVEGEYIDGTPEKDEPITI